MKQTASFIASYLGLLALSSQAWAANVVQMSISRRDSPIELRERSILENLFNNVTGGSYMVDVKVGNPAQSLSLVLDTGSGDTWVLSKTADQCSVAAVANKYGGCVGGTFDAKASSTFKTVAVGAFNITYVDQTGSSGDYFTDNLQIGGSTIKDLQMGLAFKVTTGVGIMGIAYQSDEAAKTKYPNIIDQMVSQKLINRRAYSLWLDDLETSTGNILFGGIDTEKFIGTLKAIPVQPDVRSKTIISFTVYLTGVLVTDNSGKATQITATSYSLPVILDSGSTFTHLPGKVVTAIIQSLGAIDDTSYSGDIFVDCDWRTTRPNSFLSFSFGTSGGPTINVPLNEFIISFRTLNGKPKGSTFTNTCFLGIRPHDQDNLYLFGDTFLRSAYVVYDLDHNQIALAQTNFEATGRNVQEIPASATGIPLLPGKSTGQTAVPQSHFTNKPSTTTGASVATAPVATAPVATNRPSTTGTAPITAPGSPSSSSSFPGSPRSSSTGTPQAPRATAVGTVPAFDKAALVLLTLSSLLALVGGSCFLVC